MWVQAIFSRDDVLELLRDALPARILLGEPSDDAWLALYDLGEVSFVPDVGVRVACKAKLRWAVAGVTVPVTLHSLTIMLRPQILKRETGDALCFGLEIEHADLVNVPNFLDVKITERINRALSAKRDDMAWDFATALSRVVPLPSRIEPIDAIDVKIAWGELRIDAQAMVIAISLHAHLLRDGATDSSVSLVSPGSPVMRPGRAVVRRPVQPNALLLASGVAFLSGALIAAMWMRSGA